MYVAGDRQMGAGRGEMLADGWHAKAIGVRVAHDVEDLLVGFAEVDHHS